MTIVVIHQQFLQPGEGGGSRFNEFTRLWAEAGHRVTVIAGQTGYASGRRLARYRGHWAYRELQGGVTVLRVYTPPAEMRSVFSRLWNYLCFMLSSTWAALFLAPRPDVIIATSPHLIVAIPGIVGARLRRCPLVFEVRDLWPETGISTGAIRPGSLFARALFSLEARAYRSAAAITVLTPAFGDNILGRGMASPERIWVIPNGVDFSLFRPVESRVELRHRHGWQDAFVALYAGAHGFANDLLLLVEAAELLRGEPEVRLISVGAGAELAMLREEVRRRALPNLRLLGEVPKAEMPGYLAAADVGLAVLRKCETFKTVYPNKVFDYMALRLPVVLAIDGVARQLVEEAGAGLYVEPGDAPALARAILWLRDHRQEAAKMGERGERCVRKDFDRVDLGSRYLRHLGELVARERARLGGR
jgi:glycosyltransferase involved in cell wall biosynthesis